MTAADRREEYRYDVAGKLTERLVFGIRKGMGTGKEETGNGDARRTDAGRIDAGRADAGIIGLGSIGNEIHSIHTDERTFEDSIEKSLAGSLSHAGIGNTGSLKEVVCPTELALSASYHYSYDRQGNTLSDGENQYRYASRNRLTEIETQNGDLQKNRYDGEGLRAELEENGELTRFLYSGRDIVAEQDEKNNTVRYVRGLELLSSDCECARTYYHYASDELGSITHVTDENGTTLNRYSYDAFGNRAVKEERVQNRFGFTGENCDGLTGQYYLRARFYNPVIGKFLNEDTYYGDGLNLYSYCRNNPVRYVDPSGHWCQEKQARIDKYKEHGYSEADAEKMANYEKLRETEGVDAAEKYLREQKAPGEGRSKTDLQSVADKAAQDYNAKYNPADRAIKKGHTKIKKTANGGVSFQGTEDIYKIDGQEARTSINATGSRQKDFSAANNNVGLKETPDGYVWHHVDDYNVSKNTITMELVKDEPHTDSKPHSGDCAQYDAVHGPSYNPPRKGGKKGNV